MDTTNFNPSFSLDPDSTDRAKILVVGIGGGGGNALNNMIAQGITGIDYVAINTDAQALQNNIATLKIQVGTALTKGLGAGARPEVGAQAVEENFDEIETALKGYDMVFITAGMGGGTGTGATPVVAAIARRLGILTVAIVTKPFDCEGKKRSRSAEAGIKKLRESVDTIIVIPNEQLLQLADTNLTLVDAFLQVDDVLYNATRGISDLITEHGQINLDFADVKTTMENGGTALMGSATASGENRAQNAALAAISSPLLEGLSIYGARNVLVNITANSSLGIHEAMSATKAIQETAGDEAEVIFGVVIDDNMEGNLRVTVIATGFDSDDNADAKTKTVEAATLPPTIRKVPLDEDFDSPLEYRGEENLKKLDEPAYTRRGTPPPEESKTSILGENDDTTRGDGQQNNGHNITIHRLSNDNNRNQGSSNPPPNPPKGDGPNFRRKLMD